MSQAPALSSAGEYARTQDTALTPSIDVENIDRHYHVEEIAEKVRQNNFHIVCLQFPDQLVRDSTYVASSLQRRVEAKVFVLADTSYSPCCVDEIAAQHVKGDVVFHFGHACLNPARSIPVFYVVHGNPGVNTLNIRDRIVQLANSLDASQKLLLYPDTTYTDVASGLLASKVDIALPAPEKGELVPRLDVTTSDRIAACSNRRILSLSDPLTPDEYELVYLSDSPSDSLLLYWSTVFPRVRLIDNNGNEQDASPALRRRYRDVQAIKAAGTIGILINTLSLKDSIPLLDRMRSAITQVQKKYYTFVVGKPNVAKLGNFEVVDVWVVLGCPEGGIILDDDDYTKPIVTPYELELAFNDEWTGKWLLNFNDVLKEVVTLKESDEPLFDLITGKFVFNNAPLRDADVTELKEGELRTSSNALTIRSTVSTAAKTLQAKTWTGLGSDHTDDVEEFAALKKGRSGIARDYGEMR